MPVEFIGIARTSDYSETNALSGPVVQPEYLYRIARVHEQSGFDRVLVAHSSSMPDGFTVASQMLNATERPGVPPAHRPGFIAPTIAARKYATIDAFHPGRIALHVISGGDDAGQARDGDFSDKPARYRRTDEFLDVAERERPSPERSGPPPRRPAARPAGSRSASARSPPTPGRRPGSGPARSCDPVGDAAAYASLVRPVHAKVGDDVLGFRAAAAV